MNVYHIQEGTLSIPEHFLDNSTNVFTLAPTPQANLSITISRDRLEDGEDLTAYVKRQIQLMKTRLKGYKLLEQTSIEIGPQHVQGQLLKGTMPSQTKGQVLHLQQACVVFTEGVLTGKALIFTLNTRQAPTPEEQTQWQNLLDSYTPSQNSTNV